MQFNFGGDLSIWVYFGIIVIIIGLIVLIGEHIIKYLHTGSKKLFIQTMGLSSILLVLIFMFFVAFGPGRPNKLPPPETEGMHKIVDKMPNEKSEEELAKEAEEKKPTELKRQDESFVKDKEEADRYIEEALKKAKNN